MRLARFFASKQQLTPAPPNITVELKMPDLPQAPEQGKASRIAKVLTAVIPIIISAIALTYAIRSYSSQSVTNNGTRAAQAAVRASAQEADASLVSGWVETRSNGNHDIVIQNLGRSPIYDVEVEVLIHNDRDDLALYFPGPPWAAGLLPPCSQETISLLSYLADLKRVVDHDAPPPDPQLALIYFIDTNGNSWSRSVDGILKKSNEPDRQTLNEYVNDFVNGRAASIANVKTLSNCP